MAKKLKVKPAVAKAKVGICGEQGSSTLIRTACCVCRHCSVIASDSKKHAAISGLTANLLENCRKIAYNIMINCWESRLRRLWRPAESG